PPVGAKTWLARTPAPITATGQFQAAAMAAKSARLRGVSQASGRVASAQTLTTVGQVSAVSSTSMKPQSAGKRSGGSRASEPRHRQAKALQDPGCSPQTLQPRPSPASLAQGANASLPSSRTAITVQHRSQPSQL